MIVAQRNALSILIIAATFSGCNRIPTQVHEAIFKKSNFSTPIGISVGRDDGAAALAWARSHRTTLIFVPVTNYVFFDKVLLSFLVQHGYSSVECMAKDYCYVVHNAKIAELSHIAVRRLVSITYSKKYDTNMLGTPVTVAALTFKYRIEVDDKNFPSVDQIFDGAGKAILNPDTGNWQLEQLSLTDKGSAIFNAYIYAHYQPFRPKPVESGREAAVAPEAEQRRQTPAQAGSKLNDDANIDLTALRSQGYVSDFAGVIDPPHRRQLEDYCANLERLTGAQLALVVVPSLNGKSVEEVAKALFGKWGMGEKGKNNGALLLISIGDRRNRLEVGYGLESITNVGQVLLALRPYLRSSRFGDGLVQAANTIGTQIEQAKGGAPQAHPKASGQQSDQVSGSGTAPGSGSVENAGTVYRVGNGVSAPSILSKQEPAYSEQARTAKLQGTVQLYLEVDPSGRAQNIKVLRGVGLGLDEKAIEAVSKWRFRPGYKDGRPVTTSVTVEVNFRLL
jgi:TonB family protein